MKSLKIRNLAAKSPLLRKGGVHRDRRRLETDARQQLMEDRLAWEEEVWEPETDRESLEPPSSPEAGRAWWRRSWTALAPLDAPGPGRFSPIFCSPFENKKAL